MRTCGALIFGIGALMSGGCFSEPPGGTGATNGGSSESGDDVTTGAPAEEILLFDLACDGIGRWLTTPNLTGNLFVELQCGVDGENGARVEAYDAIALSDGKLYEDVIEIDPPRLAGGGIIGEFLAVDISEFENPVLRADAACGEDTPDCEVDIQIDAYDATDLLSNAGPTTTRKVSASSGVMPIQLPLRAGGLDDDVDDIDIVLVVSASESTISEDDNVAYLSRLRIEEDE